MDKESIKEALGFVALCAIGFVVTVIVMCL